MAWTPRPVDPPPAGWWTELETAEQWKTRRWVEGIAARLRAERVECLRALAHEVDMRAAGVLARDRWDRSQRRRDERSVRSYGGDEPTSWRGLPVEHSAAAGRVLRVGGRLPGSRRNTSREW